MAGGVRPATVPPSAHVRDLPFLRISTAAPHGRVGHVWLGAKPCAGGENLASRNLERSLKAPQAPPSSIPLQVNRLARVGTLQGRAFEVGFRLLFHQNRRVARPQAHSPPSGPPDESQNVEAHKMKPILALQSYMKEHFPRTLRDEVLCTCGAGNHEIGRAHV